MNVIYNFVVLIMGSIIGFVAGRIYEQEKG